MERLIRKRWVPEATETPSAEVIAWAAGFIEGEGSFCRAANKHSFRISVSQKNIEPLQKLQKFFGGSIKPKKARRIWFDKQQRFIGSTESYIWRLYNKSAQDLAKTLYPWLSQKRKDQAMELIDLSYTNPTPSGRGPVRMRDKSE